MKISEIAGPRAFEVLPDLIDAIQLLLEDPELGPLLNPLGTKPKDTDWSEFKGVWAKNVAKTAPKHADELIKLFALIRGITPEEYKKNMTVGQFLNDFFDLPADSLFVDLFI